MMKCVKNTIKEFIKTATSYFTLFDFLKSQTICERWLAATTTIMCERKKKHKDNYYAQNKKDPWQSLLFFSTIISLA